MRWAVVRAPIGQVSIGVSEQGVAAVRLPRYRAAGPVDGPGGDTARHEIPGHDPTDVLGEAVAQVRAYFAGERTDFGLPLSIPEEIGSDFERAVWAALAGIPYGQTWTYGQVAAAVRDPGDARAVGVACNRNPLPLLVPCHRVVGAGRTLVGFGVGLATKRWLLEHEASVTLLREWG